jgi:hypothetical protein
MSIITPIHNDREQFEALEWISRAVLPQSFPIFRNATIHARFYPYIGLTHTIRRSPKGWELRISDHCRRAPKPVLEAIILLLGAKIARQKPGKKSVEIYEAFRKDSSIQDSVKERRKSKGRKRIAVAEGKHHSLSVMCNEVNRQFFNDQAQISRIGWGMKRSWRRLGHYDPAHHSITISPVLDSAKVPDYVIRFIVYHEMLHDVFADIFSDRFRKHHPPEFTRAEHAHPDYANAKRFLKEYCSRRRK